MPTIKELWENLTALAADVTALKSKAPSSDPTALANEVTARLKLESDFTALKGEFNKALAAVPPPEKGADENPHAAAIAALEKAITVLKATAPAPEKDDKDTEDTAKAENDSDTADDTEACAARTAKDFSKVLAIRTAQFSRKQAYVPKMAAKISAITLKKSVTAEIAKLGILLPLAMKKDGKNPIREEAPSRSRAHRLAASGFNEMPAIAALNSSLGRAVKN